MRQLNSLKTLNNTTVERLVDFARKKKAFDFDARRTDAITFFTLSTVSLFKTTLTE